MGAKYGQHFLTDSNVISHILNEFGQHDHVVEVGPGKGALTYKLLENSKKVTVIEIDPILQEYWINEKTKYANLDVICCDALQYDFDLLYTGEKFSIISNLPYEITGPFLIKIIKKTSLWDFCLLMLQKEIVEKITAPAGDRMHGRLTVQIERHCLALQDLIIYPASFNPRPKVDSQLVKLYPQDKGFEVDEELWDKTLVKAFASQRKMVRVIFKDENLEWDKINIDPTLRPSSLTLKNWYDLILARKTQHAN